jgi:hypothetical protein
VKAWLPWLAALVGGAICGGIAWTYASGDVDKLGDWYGGAESFIGTAGAIGIFGGYIVTSRLTRGAKLARDGFTLSYRRIEAQPAGYRELTTVRVADLLAALREAGYEPRTEACDDLGTRRGAFDATSPLAGANVAITDPRVRGWIRVHLPVPRDDQARGLGLVEIWSRSGDSAEELALFTLRALGTLIANLEVARESSNLSPDPVATVTAGLSAKRA